MDAHDAYGDFLVASYIEGEAGGEGERGMRAVANVIANRARANHAGYGETASAQARAPYQFQRRAVPSATALELARRVNEGTLADITGGAIYYANPGNSTESWARRLNSANSYQIGRHFFTNNATGQRFAGPDVARAPAHPHTPTPGSPAASIEAWRRVRASLSPHREYAPAPAPAGKWVMVANASGASAPDAAGLPTGNLRFVPNSVAGQPEHPHSTPHPAVVASTPRPAVIAPTPHPAVTAPAVRAIEHHHPAAPTPHRAVIVARPGALPLSAKRGTGMVPRPAAPFDTPFGIPSAPIPAQAEFPSVAAPGGPSDFMLNFKVAFSATVRSRA